MQDVESELLTVPRTAQPSGALVVRVSRPRVARRSADRLTLGQLSGLTRSSSGLRATWRAREASGDRKPNKSGGFNSSV